MMRVAVWLSRLLVGAVFIVSGAAKMIDPIGFSIKISSYLAVWGLTDAVPPGLVLVGGAMLSTFEFVIGILVASGSLRRAAARGALALMCFMLPLSAYIALANPVSDCGCFGDFLVISNGATFAKNLVITALCVFLVIYNRRARTLFAPWIQWMQIAAAAGYVIILGIIGYHEQPLVDFRPYPAGEPLADDSEAQALYVYTRNGREKTFSDSQLPDEDSGWEFKELREVKAASAKQLTLLDPKTALDVTDSVVRASGDRMLLLIPHPTEASAAGSYTANELCERMERLHGPGAFVAIMPPDSAAVKRALDVMMVDYPVYFADQKAIMAVARGAMAVVYLRNGLVVWKRTLSSISPERISSGDPATTFATNGPKWFRILTAAYILANLAIYILGRIPALIRYSLL